MLSESSEKRGWKEVVPPPLRPMSLSVFAASSRAPTFHGQVLKSHLTNSDPLLEYPQYCRLIVICQD